MEEQTELATLAAQGALSFAKPWVVFRVGLLETSARALVARLQAARRNTGTTSHNGYVTWRWVDGRELLDHARELLAYSLRLEDLSCCTMQAGFFMWANDQPRNGPGTVDEFSNALAWLESLDELLEGGCGEEVAVWAWEESGCRMRWLDAQRLALLDRHPRGDLLCQPIACNMADFCGQLLREAAVMCDLGRRLRQESVGHPSAERRAEKFAVLTENLPDATTQELLEHLGQRLARLST